ncbi:MAG: YdcF family protein [Bacteroidales bacterium]|nr:YdcF family protein [Bacteroidales bacterium]
MLIFLGSISLILIILAFTSAPFWIRYNMATAKSGISVTPEYIIVLGGGGIPGESGLMRTYYGAITAAQFPTAKVIVTLPGDITDSLSSVNRMKQELIVRGVSPERILVEDSGANTRAEALMIRELILRDKITDTDTKAPMHHSPFPILLITSPEHLYRAVLTFQKAGFRQVDGVPTFEQDLESDLGFSSRRLGGRAWVPDVGENITLRYRFWNYLQYEFIILREWVAIAYYWLMGWI